MASACFYCLSIAPFLFLITCAAQETICPFEYIYQLGDSISDTGNLIHESALGAGNAAVRVPYGETFLDKPTGRWSNGLLIIDFICVALSLPLLNPYLERNASFNHGANFAVAGSTALDSSFLAARGIHNPKTNNSLNIQLNWFTTHLNSICHTPAECQRRLSRALVLVGEIGGNDINYACEQGKPIQEIRTYVPYIVETIINVVREVIYLGAVKIIVPGNFPLGCFPAYLTLSPNGDPTAYDDMGCLRSLNELALLQNNYLQGALALLRVEFPHVVILYADYYTAFQSVVRRAPYLGLGKKSLLKACCGIGGPYNFDWNMMCGSAGVPVCSNPGQYISWDGIHLTEKAYLHISEILISNILPRINCTGSLPAYLRDSH